jgi:hypothetical protein
MFKYISEGSQAFPLQGYQVSWTKPQVIKWKMMAFSENCGNPASLQLQTLQYTNFLDFLLDGRVVGPKF